jgi:hypothetical protein
LLSDANNKPLATVEYSHDGITFTNLPDMPLVKYGDKNSTGGLHHSFAMNCKKNNLTFPVGLIIDTEYWYFVSYQSSSDISITP